jgi:glycosyltransferase involved in cell wall biosynthesis
MVSERATDQTVAERPDRIGVLMLNVPREIYAPQQIHAAIAQSLDRRRFRVYAAIPQDCVDPAAWRGASDLTLWQVPFGAGIAEGRGPVRRLRAGLGLAQFGRGVLAVAVRARAAGIQIIHTETGPRDSLAGVLLARLTGAALVVHLHEIRQSEQTPWFRLATRSARTIIAVSEASRASYARVGVIDAAKTRVVHNGVDVRRFRPDLDGSAVRADLGLPAELPLVLLPGRLVPWKGQSELVRAVAWLKERGRPVVVLLVGQDDVLAPDYRQQLQQEIAALGLTEQVRLIPFRDDLPAVMAAADVVAVPSYEEPFGMVVIEAMASGRSVVAAGAGGIPEIIDHEASGLLVPPKDPVALGAAIQRLLDDPGLRARLVAEAQRRVLARFTRERMVEEVAQVYESLLAPARGLAAQPILN